MPPVLFNIFRCLLFAVVIAAVIGGWVGAAIGATAGFVGFCWLSLIERNQRKKRLKDAEQNQRGIRSEKVLGRRRERQEKRQAIRNAVAHADEVAGKSQAKFLMSALHVAAAQNNPVAVAELIKRGDDVNVRNHVGWTPLHYAKYHGATDAYAVLVNSGADEDAKSEFGETPKTLHRKSEFDPPPVRPMSTEESMRLSATHNRW